MQEYIIIVVVEAKILGPMATLAAAAGISGAPNLSSLLRHQIVKPVQVPPPRARSFHVRRRTAWRRASSSTPPPAEAASPGLYSAKVYELTKENVNLVLDDVRPYLISDGGNVDVVSVEDGVISLQLQGACGSCPSSTTTMKMGIERVLKEKFGEAVKDICQVEGIQIETTVEAVNNHLEILRPAIKNFGGSVEVVSVEAGDCSVRYTGPDSIGSGIKAAIKEKFPDIINVVFI